MHIPEWRAVVVGSVTSGVCSPLERIEDGLHGCVA